MLVVYAWNVLTNMHTAATRVAAKIAAAKLPEKKDYKVFLVEIFSMV